MPSIVTHYLFSEDVYNQTEKTIQKNLKQAKQIYNICAQSFDNLFYYNFLSLKSGNTIRQLGLDAQREKCSDYFKNMILTIKECQAEDNPEALAYLYGSLTHYILDRNCHPFVIYYAGWIDKLNKQNKIYRGLHEKIEVGIDAIYWKEKRNINLYQDSLGNILLPKQLLSSQLKEILDQTYEKTFDISNMGSIYEQSINQGHTIIKYFITDHFGIKKLAYTLFDLIFYKNTRKYQNLSFYIKQIDTSILNRNHEEWCNPTDDNLKSTESFDDLYQKSIEEALKIFHLVHQVIHNNLDLNSFLNILEDRSYVTGLDWKENRTIQYFDKKKSLKKENLE